MNVFPSNTNYVISYSNIAYSTLVSTYGYYLGKGIAARYSVDNNNYSPSEFFAARADDTFFKTKPGSMTAAPTYI